MRNTCHLVANLVGSGMLLHSSIPKFYCAVITATDYLVLEKVYRINIAVMAFERSYSCEACGVPGHNVFICACGADSMTLAAPF